MISQKVFDPPIRPWRAGGVVGREDGFAGETRVRSNEGQQSSRDIRSADRFTTSKYSLLLFPPCPRTSVQQRASELHNFTALRGRPALPHTRVTIHYVRVIH